MFLVHLFIKKNLCTQFVSDDIIFIQISYPCTMVSYVCAGVLQQLNELNWNNRIIQISCLIYARDSRTVLIASKD